MLGLRRRAKLWCFIYLKCNSNIIAVADSPCFPFHSGKYNLQANFPERPFIFESNIYVVITQMTKGSVFERSSNSTLVCLNISLWNCDPTWAEQLQNKTFNTTVTIPNPMLLITRATSNLHRSHFKVRLSFCCAEHKDIRRMLVTKQSWIP